MTARELIKHLETCDLDKDVAVVITFIENEGEELQAVLRLVKNVIEKDELIGLE